MPQKGGAMRLADIPARQVKGRDTSDTPRKGSLLTLPVTPSVRRSYAHRKGLRAMDIEKMDRIEIVLQFILAKKRVTKWDIKKATGAGTSTVVGYLKILRERGQIRQSKIRLRTVYYSPSGESD
jgi:hypothetical protein